MYYILGAGGLDAQKVLEGLRGSAETPAGARRTERKLRRALGGRNFGGALASYRRWNASGVPGGGAARPQGFSLFGRLIRMMPQI